MQLLRLLRLLLLSLLLLLLLLPLWLLLTEALRVETLLSDAGLVFDILEAAVNVIDDRRETSQVSAEIRHIFVNLRLELGRVVLVLLRNRFELLERILRVLSDSFDAAEKPVRSGACDVSSLRENRTIWR